MATAGKTSIAGREGANELYEGRDVERLAYASGARRRDPARERLRALGLDSIGLTEAIFGLALLGWCGLSVGKLAYAGLGFSAFLACAAVAGVCQVGAAALLLARRWGRARVVRRTQQLAAGSVGPLVLFGVGMTIWAGIAAYRGTDMFAGLAVAMGIGLTIVTSFVAALALTAVRMLRRDGDLSDCVTPAPAI